MNKTIQIEKKTQQVPIVSGKGQAPSTQQRLQPHHEMNIMTR